MLFLPRRYDAICGTAKYVGAWTGFESLPQAANEPKGAGVVTPKAAKNAQASATADEFRLAAQIDRSS